MGDFMEQLYWVRGREGKHISTIVHFPRDGQEHNIPVIVYCHGFTANKTADNRMGVRLARALCKQGYLVVRFDYIGSGESEGEFETETYLTGWIQDFNAVISTINNLPRADMKRVGLIGHSLGGALVTHLSSVNHDIKVVCALAPVSRLKENFKQIIIGPKLWKQALENKTIKDFYNKKYSLSPLFVQDLLQYQILESARKITIPFFIIHGKEDNVVPYQHSYDLLQSLKSKDKTIKIFNKEAHLFTRDIDTYLIKWFDAKL